ncbi:MAG: hypothetical protein JWR89_2882 [Tardiphaga sp.]|nr:hypothetical protein [Tardiphaga sp.]
MFFNVPIVHFDKMSKFCVARAYPRYRGPETDLRLFAIFSLVFTNVVIYDLKLLMLVTVHRYSHMSFPYNVRTCPKRAK